MNRVEGREKVTGRARYADEYPAEDVAYVHPVQAAVARGRVLSVDTSVALATPGVLAVLSCLDPPLLGSREDPELALFQTDEVAYSGQLVAAVVARTLETAREAAEHGVRITYDAEPHDVLLRTDHPGLYTPETVNPGYPAESAGATSRPRWPGRP